MSISSVQFFVRLFVELVVDSFLSFYMSRFSFFPLSFFLFSYKQRTFVPADSKKMTEKSVFRESWNDVTIIPSPSCYTYQYIGEILSSK